MTDSTQSILALVAWQKERIEKLEAALEWYADTVGDCRRHSSDGEDARHALNEDCGDRARCALVEDSR